MGVIGMHMANEGLTADTFQKFEHSHLVEMFSIDTQVSVDSGIAGVSMTQPVRVPALPCNTTLISSVFCTLDLYKQLRNLIPPPWYRAKTSH